MDPTDKLVEALRRKINHLTDRLDAVEAENKALRGRIGELESKLSDAKQHIELVDGTMGTPKKGEMEKILGVIDYATNEATGGPAGKLVRTGEVAAAANTSRSNALRLMDKIAATFPWAEVRNPGGPKPKQLRVNLAENTPTEIRASVENHYRDGATA